MPAHDDNENMYYTPPIPLVLIRATSSQVIEVNDDSKCKSLPDPMVPTSMPSLIDSKECDLTFTEAIAGAYNADQAMDMPIWIDGVYFYPNSAIQAAAKIQQEHCGDYPGTGASSQEANVLCITPNKPGE